MEAGYSIGALNQDGKLHWAYPLGGPFFKILCQNPWLGDLNKAMEDGYPIGTYITSQPYPSGQANVRKSWLVGKRWNQIEAQWIYVN